MKAESFSRSNLSSLKIRVMLCMFKLFQSLMIVALLASNALTITSASFFDAVSGIFNKAVPSLMTKSPSSVQSRALARERSARKVMKAKVRRVTSSVGKRVARGAALSLSSAPAEMVPYAGAAFVLGALAVELNDACETMKELDELTSQLEMTFGEPLEVNKVCGMEVPSYDVVLAETKKRRDDLIGNAKESFTSFQDVVGGTLFELLNGR